MNQPNSVLKVMMAYVTAVIHLRIEIAMENGMVRNLEMRAMEFGMMMKVLLLMLMEIPCFMPWAKIWKLSL